MLRRASWGIAALLILGACGDDGGNGDGDGGAGDCTATLVPGSADQDAVQGALIDAATGDVLCFSDGTFSFTDELSLSVPGVTLRGSGSTVLDFSAQARGGNGLLLTGDDTRVERLTVRNTPGDGIRAEGVDGITFQDVTVEWEGPPSRDNGAYGLYPVLSRNVLIDGCRVRGASDAGIYVGQSEDIIVRNSEAWENVAGIEIENCSRADVHDNHAHDNTAGILVFALPNLQRGESDTTRVFDNLVESNNTENFAPAGNIVALVPRGTGALLLATDDNEIFGNTFRDNTSGGLFLLGFGVTGRSYDDPDYDPTSGGNYVHDNVFENNATDPAPLVVALAGEAAPADMAWDGVEAEGQAPNCFENNGNATWLDFDLDGSAGGPSTDLSLVTCTGTTLPPVTVDAP